MEMDQYADDRPCMISIVKRAFHNKSPTAVCTDRPKMSTWVSKRPLLSDYLVVQPSCSHLCFLHGLRKER